MLHPALPLSLGATLHRTEAGCGRIRPRRLKLLPDNTRLAGPRVGAFWRPRDPAWISLPRPAWPRETDEKALDKIVPIFVKYF
jgi:hypothetical protein